MTLTLAESAKLTLDELQRGVIETFVQESPILDRLPLVQVEGSAFKYNEESSLPGVAFRAINEAYPESTGTLNQRVETLAILGGDADVDKFIVQTRGNLNDQRAIQTHMKVKAASIHFADQFFNGDVEVNPKGFDGLRKRLVGRQVIDAGGKGAVAHGHDFFDLLDTLTNQVRGIDGKNGALYMNAALRAKIASGFRRLGGSELLTVDIAGKPTVMWNGIPLLDAGQRLDGTDVLPLTTGTGVRRPATSTPFASALPRRTPVSPDSPTVAFRSPTWASPTTSRSTGPASTSTVASRSSAVRQPHALPAY
ncbi:major capsid protein [Streptomyces roseolus]|uniref:major capsid protein n=1 Tax=Streptomyces roseolus TaxID=67358 RepID=UPI0033C6BBBE